MKTFILGINYTKREMGRDKFSFEISKKYYLKDRKVSLSEPEYAFNEYVLDANDVIKFR